MLMLPTTTPECFCHNNMLVLHAPTSAASYGVLVQWVDHVEQVLARVYEDRGVPLLVSIDANWCFGSVVSSVFW